MGGWRALCRAGGLVVTLLLVWRGLLPRIARQFDPVETLVLVESLHEDWWVDHGGTVGIACPDR